MKFFLGTHQPQWLSFSDVPLFISDVRLRSRRGYPRAARSWSLDSGAFTQLATRGSWERGSVRAYCERVARYRSEIGSLCWASPQDWMCEPFMLAKTGKTLLQHQLSTVENYCDLRLVDDSLPFIPVLQGWDVDDYFRCADLYHAYGVDISSCGVVGVGSVCRRQGTATAVELFTKLHVAFPLVAFHGFGVKVSGLRRFGQCVGSADSMAWSYDARRKPALPGHAHRNCANCWDYARQWYSRVTA